MPVQPTDISSPYNLSGRLGADLPLDAEGLSCGISFVVGLCSSCFFGVGDADADQN